MWVIKYGGNAMTDANERAQLLADVRQVRAADGHPVLVHGGGPFIAAELEAAGVASRFERGLRVTTLEAIGPVERALTLLGKRLAAELGDAVALTGRDADLLRAERADPALGEVGRDVTVRRAALDAVLAAGLTPVVACLALDATGAPLNVNADEVAGARVVHLTDNYRSTQAILDVANAVMAQMQGAPGRPLRAALRPAGERPVLRVVEDERAVADLVADAVQERLGDPGALGGHAVLV
ncbi:MAG: hypothetical protein P1P87_14750, partial [Trueperaceae bacterium]|nr:hypothetical protein [Trueperaceae bacterium]